MHHGQHITRQKFVIVLIGLLWLGLWVRIGLIQCFEHELLHKKALNQRVKPVTINASRGFIMDRNGVQLAISLSSSSYGLHPKKIEDINSTVRDLSGVTGISVASLKNKISTKKNFFWLIREADTSIATKLDKTFIKGLDKLSESKRYYPLGKIGAHVIGYTDIDGNGIEGCEVYLNDELSELDGRSIVYRDAKGSEKQSLDEPYIEPQDGLDVVLTLDWRIQEIAEEELEKCVQKLKAIWGGAIILDPESGEILAMANVPCFDPNDPSCFNPSSFDPNNRRNRLVTDMLEPGSTFKIVTFIEAFESGIVKEDDKIDCENGRYKIGRHTINDTHEMDIVPANEVFIHSSNIGTVKIAERIGKQRLYERARLLGFDSVTGIDFPKETEGNLPNPRKWSKLSLPTISFGHGVAVSPLQIACAYGAIANNGLLVRPHLVKEIIGTDGRPGCTVEKRTIRRAMTQETARRLTDLLCETVISGTSKSAALPNVAIAGKTGTAQRVMEKGKGYYPDRYVSSFVGFITDREPKLLCFVMIDSPVGVYYGSQVAAPVFKQIINRILNMGDGPCAYAMVEKNINIAPKSEILPDMKGMNIHEAVAVLSELGFNPSVAGDSTIVMKQFPPTGAKLGKGADVTLYSDIVISEKQDLIKVPNIRGKTVREAVQDLVQSQLKVNVVGSGTVQKQDPPAGTLVKHGTVCVIACGKK
ncbi:penicillin-binding transpeptidase domain-containing protein [Candidatus Latescibacterota bacterium]